MKMVRREGLDEERAPVSRCLPARWYWQYRFWLTVTGSLCNQMSSLHFFFSFLDAEPRGSCKPLDRGKLREPTLSHPVPARLYKP